MSTGANVAFTATGGGTVTATQNNSTIVNTIATTSGNGLVVANTTIGAAGLTFRSITAGTASGTAGVGISLDTTGSSGGLTVVGNSTAGSGGTIQHKTGSDGSTTSGIGIYLNSTSNVSLARMQLNDFDNYAILGTNVAGFTLNHTTVNGTIGTLQGGIGEGAVYFTGLTGSASISNSSFSGSAYDTFHVFNNGGTLDRITITNCTFAMTNTGGNDALTFQATGGTFNATVQSCTISSARGDLFQLNLLGAVTSDLVFGGASSPLGNTLTNNNTNIVSGGGGVTIGGGGSANNVTFTYNISHNSIKGSHGAVLAVTKGTSGVGGTFTGGSFTGTIDSNVIGTQGTFASGSTQGEGIAVYHDGTGTGGGTSNTTITNNHVSGVVAGRGAIDVYVHNGNAAKMTAVIQGNIADTLDQTNSFAGMYLQTGSNTGSGGDNNLSNLTIGGAGALKNSVDVGANASGALVAGICIEQEGVSRIGLLGSPNYSGGVYSDANVQTYVGGNNTFTGSNAQAVFAFHDSTSPAGGGYFGTAQLMFAPGGIEKAADFAMHGALQPGTAQTSIVPGRGTSTPAVGGIDERKASLAEARKVAADQQHPAIQSGGAMPPQSQSVVDSSTLSQEQLDSVVSAATSRWEATGLTSDQLARLRGMKFEVAAMNGDRLGETAGDVIHVSNNAGGNGWFIDASPQSDALFNTVTAATRRYTESTASPAGKVDLLTTILHEMGHALGLPDTYRLQDRNDIMYGQLTKGERRLPAKDEAKGAVPFAGNASHFLSGALNPITIGTLPAGKSVIITYQVQLENPITPNSTSQISSQATVHSTTASFSDVTSTDVAGGVATGSGPTITLLAIPPAFTNGPPPVHGIVGTAYGPFTYTPPGHRLPPSPPPDCQPT